MAIAFQATLRKEAAATFALGQNYPNPVQDGKSTTIPFTIPSDGAVALKFFDMLGNEKATLNYGKMPAGKHEAEFSPDGCGLVGGVYICRLECLAEGRNYVTAMKLIYDKK